MKSCMKRGCTTDCLFMGSYGLKLLLLSWLLLASTTGANDGCDEEKSRASRIVGGRTAPKGRFPYMVSLREYILERHICGGVLIKDNVVLTAAHCVRGERSKETNPKVAIGAHFMDLSREPDIEVFTACKTIVHQSFNGKAEGGFDIALLILDKKSKKKPIVEMDPGGRNDRDGMRMTAAGWGRTAPNGALASELQFVDGLEYVNNGNCDKAYTNSDDTSLITANMLCALKEGQDTCGGDSGGPLIFNRGSKCHDQDILMGLTSFGDTNCGGSGSPPGVYTRISEFIVWIEQMGAGASEVFDSNARECVGFTGPGTGGGTTAPPANGNSDSNAASVIGKIAAGKTASASTEIIALSKEGERGKNELGKVVSESESQGLLSGAARAFLQAGEEDPSAGKVLEPYLERLVESITVSDLSITLLKDGKDLAVRKVLAIIDDKETFPDSSSRQQILLNATKAAVQEARKKPNSKNSMFIKIASILLAASESRQGDVLTPAVNYINGVLDGE